MFATNHYRVAIVFTALYVMLTARTADRSGSIASVADRAMTPTIGPASGALVVAGGNIKDAAIIERFLELAGGPDVAIVVVPTAAEGDVYSLEWDYLEPFRDAGATSLTVLHTRDPDEADTQAFVAPLKDATGVWFVGGRQWRIADSYLGTLTEKEFRAVLDRGGVSGGSSAVATSQCADPCGGVHTPNKTPMWARAQ